MLLSRISNGAKLPKINGFLARSKFSRTGRSRLLLITDLINTKAPACREEFVKKLVQKPGLKQIVDEETTHVTLSEEWQQQTL